MISVLLRQFTGVALYTVKAAARRPLSLLLITVTLGLMVLLPSTVAFNLGDANRMARDGALALFAVSGMFLALAAPATAAYEPASAGVLALNLCTPAGRTVLLLGRYAGLALLIIWYSAIAIMGLLLTERIALPAPDFDLPVLLVVLAAVILAIVCAACLDFQGRASFPGAALAALLPAMLLATIVAGCMYPATGCEHHCHAMCQHGKTVSDCFHNTADWCRFGVYFNWSLLPAGGLITLALLIMTAMAVMLTVRLPLHLTTIIYLGVLVAGSIVDYLVQRVPSGVIRKALLGLLPAWQDFWAAEALASSGITLAYCAATTVYATLYITALLCAAVYLFQRWEPR
jgi:hypothetical protein